MDTKLMQLLESKRQEVMGRSKRLVEGWSRYINAVDHLLQKQGGQPLTEETKVVIARCLDNAALDGGLKSSKRLMEATYQSDIAFLGIQLPVIAALIPSLALNYCSVTQALDRRQGQVFYMKINYGTSKGEVTAGTTMVDARSGHARANINQRRYATNRIGNEVLAPADSVGTQTFAGTLKFKYLTAFSVSVTATVGSATYETLTDNGAGTLASTEGGSGTIDYESGDISVTFNGVPVNGTDVVVNYRFDMGKDTRGVGEVNFKLIGETIEAEDFKLRSLYEMGAALDLEKAHGLNFEDEMMKFLGGEIKFEIDHMGLDKIVEDSQAAGAAGGTVGIGTANLKPGSGQEWVFTKYNFLDYVEKGRNQIIAATLRCQPTYMICGTNVKRVAVQLTNHFKPESLNGGKVPAGPYRVGELDGLDVILDPLIDPDTYTLGFKGDSMLYGSSLFAPYIPMFATPTLVMGTLEAQKGFMASAGFKTLNQLMLTFGQVGTLLDTP